MMDFDAETGKIVQLRCEGCDDTFSGVAQDAFDLGWDCYPWFTAHTKCPKCPITVTFWWRLRYGSNG